MVYKLMLGAGESSGQEVKWGYAFWYARLRFCIGRSIRKSAFLIFEGYSVRIFIPFCVFPYLLPPCWYKYGARDHQKAVPYDRDEAQCYGVLIRQAAESFRPEPDAVHNRVSTGKYSKESWSGEKRYQRPQKHFSENASDHRQLTVNFEDFLICYIVGVGPNPRCKRPKKELPSLFLEVRASAERRHAVLACGGAHHQNWSSKNFNSRFIKLQQPLTISSMRYLCGYGQ